MFKKKRLLDAISSNYSRLVDYKFHQLYSKKYLSLYRYDVLDKNNLILELK